MALQFLTFLESLLSQSKRSTIDAIRVGYSTIFTESIAEDIKNSYLTFKLGNMKLSGDIQILSLPAGITCPGAKNCLTASGENGNVADPKVYHKISNARILEVPGDDSLVQVTPAGKTSTFKPNMAVAITEKPIKRASDACKITEVHKVTAVDSDANLVKLDGDVDSELPAYMNNEKALTVDEMNIRCFSASDESRYGHTRISRANNYDLILATLDTFGVNGVVELINKSIRKDIKTVRIHESGDFFTEDYFVAWIEVAKKNPGMIFYGYTKSIIILAKYVDALPENLIITASRGSSHDKLIDEKNLPNATIVMSYRQAIDAGIPIDYDDSIASMPVKKRIEKYGTPNFALVLHGVQPADTLGNREIRHNSIFLKGMKARSHGYGNSVEDFKKFLEANKYSTGNQSPYIRLYDDWKAGWDYYDIHRKAIKSDNPDHRPTYSGHSTKKRAELEKRLGIKPPNIR